MKERTDIGTFEFSGNENKIDSTIDDAPKVRGGRRNAGALFVLSGDFLVPDPTPTDPGQVKRLEKVFVKLETDDSGRRGGQLEVHAVEPGKDGDKATKRLLTVNTKAIVCHVPLVTLKGVLEREPLWPWEDPTHGLPPGGFSVLLNVYGFSSEDEDGYYQKRLTWAQVVTRMDERDDWKHFPKEPLPPPDPVDDWLSPENQIKHAKECDRIQAEMGIEMDAGRRFAYISGRNRKLAEVHDDELDRAAPKDPEGNSIDPCNGANRIPL